jgi:hypothetical protein
MDVSEVRTASIFREMMGYTALHPKKAVTFMPTKYLRMKYADIKEPKLIIHTLTNLITN